MRGFLVRTMAYAMLMAPEGDGTGSGGGGGGSGGGASGGGAGSGGNAGGGTADSAKQIEALSKRNDELMARLEKLEGKNSNAGGDDPSLADKARSQREADEKRTADSKVLENAIVFNTGSKEWLKNNSTLLPKNIEGIFAQAEKENYGTAIEKADAIKVGIISEFFAQQSNLDLLTQGLKSDLEDFQKLTKAVKHERASRIWSSVFEPALEMLRRSKKAEQLSRGHGEQTAAEDAYKQKLINGSRKHYLGENQHGT